MTKYVKSQDYPRRKLKAYATQTDEILGLVHTALSMHCALIIVAAPLLSAINRVGHAQNNRRSLSWRMPGELAREQERAFSAAPAPILFSQFSILTARSRTLSAPTGRRRPLLPNLLLPRFRRCRSSRPPACLCRCRTCGRATTRCRPGPVCL